MKKLIAMGLMAVAAFGVAPSFAADCAGPVSVDCDTEDSDGNTIHCTVYVDLDGADDADGCYNLPA